ncbi:MAG TPA: DNA alkylation repair protein [Chloroflexia bacterium]|nr:DNA alkylation repair protein [Chloroflexia bacterium]
MATVTPILEELQMLGTAQTRKTYRRHGVGENVFGVSYADLYKLRKRIKVDHDLAQTLWASGNYEARILATMIADPHATDATLLATWARDLDNYAVADALAGFAAQTAAAHAVMAAWTQDEGEWTGAAGWALLAALATHDTAQPDAYFMPYLEVITREIHARPNRVRYAMNNALIAIGRRNPMLQTVALAAAARIGTVVVDHGATACKTPVAAAAIQKTRPARAGTARHAQPA